MSEPMQLNNRQHALTMLPTMIRGAADAINEHDNPAARDWAGFFAAFATLVEKLLPVIIPLFA